MEENMSNLTCASAEATTVSSINGGGIYPPPHSPKKKRNQPVGPDAEVIALSPRTLMATNRFVCEVCNKGFKRDQNLQLHRRGHNLPWKLKKRAIDEANVKRKVYICPETSCVNHDPSRALGDLTGIKKHFCRKHGEKKWKCERCSKKYAVQSDWKAHSRTCGSREYTCSCGTLFSRRDSFITHRAFCDALAEENARSTLHQTSPNRLQVEFQLNSSIKKEQEESLTPRSDLIPPWSGFPPIIWPSSLFQQNQDHNPNPNPRSIMMGPTTTLPPYHPPQPPHISATALLQKATQMGTAKCSSNQDQQCPSSTSSPPPGEFIRPHQGDHVTAGDFNLSSRDHEFINGLASYGNKAAVISSSTGTVPGANAGGDSNMMMMMMMINNPHRPMYCSSSGFEGSRFEEAAFGGMILNHPSRKLEDGDDESDFIGQFRSSRNDDDDDDYMTRDFLGLRALSQSDILSITGLGNCINTNNIASCNNDKSWQG